MTNADVVDAIIREYRSEIEFLNARAQKQRRNAGKFGTLSRTTRNRYYREADRANERVNVLTERIAVLTNILNDIQAFPIERVETRPAHPESRSDVPPHLHETQSPSFDRSVERLS